MGFADGFRTGMAWRKEYDDKQLRDKVGEAAKEGSITEGAYGAGLNENAAAVQQLQSDAFNTARDNALGQGASPEEAGAAGRAAYDQYQPAIAELQRKAGLSAPEYSVGNRTFGSQGDADAALQSLRMNKMAEVYAQGGRPEDAMRLQSMAQEGELRGLQIKGAKRRDKSEAFQEKLDEFIRGSRDLDNEGFLSGLAKLASDGKDDGQGFTYATDPQTGKIFLTQHDRGSRKEVARVEWDGDRGKLINEALKYSSAAAYDKARQEDKGDKRWDKEFGLKKDEIDIKRPYYASAAREHDAKAGYWARMPFGGGGGSASKHDWAPIGEDKDGTPVFLDKKQFDPSTPGTGLVRVDGKPIQDSVGIYRKFTGNKEPKTGLTALGSTGLVTDGQSTYALGNDGKSLVPVEMPARPGAFAMPDPNAQRTAAAAAELGGLSDTALGLRASAGDRAAAAEIQRRARAIEEEDRLSRRGLR